MYLVSNDVKLSFFETFMVDNENFLQAFALFLNLHLDLLFSFELMLSPRFQ